MTLRVLQVRDLETSGMLLTMGEDTDTPNIVSTGDHADVAVLELADTLNLVGVQVKTDGVVNLDLRIRETDGTSIMGDEGHNALGRLLNLVDTAHLVGSLIRRDLSQDETTLGVVQEAEVLLGLLDGDDIHKSSRILDVGSALAINLDGTLDEDRLGFLVVQGVFQSVAEEHNQRKALAELVGTSGRTRSPNSGELSKHPVAWRSDALHMTLRASGHLVSEFFLL